MTSDPETCPHCHFASPIDDWECMGDPVQEPRE